MGSVSERVRVTESDIDDFFEGIMITINDWDIGEHRVPGWKCKRCGWRVGSQDLPPSHECPLDGIIQENERRRRLEAVS